jgi:hypothetical protein
MGRRQFGYRGSTTQLDKRVNHNGENNGDDNDQRDHDSDTINDHPHWLQAIQHLFNQIP